MPATKVSPNHLVVHQGDRHAEFKGTPEWIDEMSAVFTELGFTVNCGGSCSSGGTAGGCPPAGDGTPAVNQKVLPLPTWSGVEEDLPPRPSWAGAQGPGMAVVANVRPLELPRFTAEHGRSSGTAAAPGRS